MPRSELSAEPPSLAQRLARSALAGAGLVAGLLAARRFVPTLTGPITEKLFRADIEREGIWGRAAPPFEKLGISQFVVFMLALGFAALGVALALAPGAVLARWRVGRRIEVPFGFAAAMAAIWMAGQGVPFHAQLAFTIVMLCVGLLPSFTADDTARYGPVSQSISAGVVVAAEAIALAWGFWIVLSPTKSLPALLLAFGILAAAAWYLGRAQAARADEQLRIDALGSVPLLCLPLAGLMREPTLKVPLLAMLAAASLRVVLRWRAPQRIPEWLAAALAPLSIAACFLVPQQFRELPAVSHHLHEAQHYGWIQSALFGRLLFADAGFMYGPLREYLLLAVSAALGGVTIEHIRMTHVLFNLVGAGILLWVGWVLGKRRFALLALWGYLLLIRSPLHSFLDYRNRISFGWADVARCALGTLALLGALSAATAAREEKARMRALFGWGVCAGFSLLYSHDVGVCALASVFVGWMADTLLRPSADNIVRHVRSRVMRLAAFFSGAALVGGGFVALYVALGRGPALLRTLRYVRTVGSGVLGASPYPLAVEDFDTRIGLVTSVPSFGDRAEYLVPPFILLMGGAVLLMTLAFRKWSARATLLLGFYVFAVISFRYTLTRADFPHLLGGVTPTYLFLIAALGDVLDFRLTFLRRQVPVSALCVAGLAFMGICSMAPDDGLLVKWKRLASGEEVVSRGPAHEWPELPHAGDVLIPSETQTLVHYIRRHTTPAQPVWVVTHLLNGGELYFLAERHDSTRFDLWAEVMMKNVDAVYVLEDLKRWPPALIIGARWRDYTDAITEWVKANYDPLPSVAGVEIHAPKPGVR